MVIVLQNNCSLWQNSAVKAKVALDCLSNLYSTFIFRYQQLIETPQMEHYINNHSSKTENYQAFNPQIPRNERTFPFYIC